MSWLSRDLVLDLLAIAIDGLNKASTRISEEREVGQWPPNDDQPIPAPAPAPAAAKPAPAATDPIPAHEPAPTNDTTNLHTKAQKILRTISLAEGADWITGTLFPHFSIMSLDQLSPTKLPELITMAQQHTKETNK